MNSGAPPRGAARPVKKCRPFGKHETAAAETAEDTNCRREKPCVLLIAVSLLAACSAMAGQDAGALGERSLRAPGITRNANHDATSVRKLQSKYGKEVRLPGEGLRRPPNNRRVSQKEVESRASGHWASSLPRPCCDRPPATGRPRNSCFQ